MTLHLIKLCVGCDSVRELEDWIKRRLKEKRRRGEKSEHVHRTRMVPKRAAELTDGGSLYWVIKGSVQVRESILDPNAKIAAGFEPGVMPVFKGQISEEAVIQLIAFIKSLSPNTPASQQGSQQPPIVIAPRAPGDSSTSTSNASRTPANSQLQ